MGHHIRIAVRVWAGLAIVLLPGTMVPFAGAQPPTRTAYVLDDDGSIRIAGVSPDTGALSPGGLVPGARDARAVVVDPSGRFVYVAAGHRVQAFGIAGGGLSSRGTATVPNVVALAVEPTGRFLYAASTATPGLSRIAIRGDGSLIAVTPIPDIGRVTALAVHPTGRFLYGLGADDGRLYAFRIDEASGTLTSLAAPAAGGTRPSALAIEPRGRSLYVSHRADGALTAFRLDAATGVPVQTQTLAVKDPASIAIERTARFLYVASPGHDAVFGYRISQSNGSLAEASVEVLSSSRPEALTIDPTNRFLYATSAAAGRVTRLGIDGDDGRLQELASEPVGGRPIALAVAHATERFLFSHGGAVDSPGATALRIGLADGSLSTVATQPLAGPPSVSVVERSGRFLYVLRSSDREIDVFRLNLSTGEPTRIQTLAVGDEFGAVASLLAAEPTGRFLFMMCGCGQPTTPQIRTLRIDPSSGQLVDVGGSAAVTWGMAASVDLTGRFLFVASGSTGISTYSIDPATGMVTLLSTVTGNVPAGQLVMDRLGRFLYAVTLPGLVHAFRVSSASGALTPAGSWLMESSLRAAAIAPTGRFFYVATRSNSWDTGGSVRGFAIDQVSGALDASTIPASYLGDRATAWSASIDATGRFLHVGYDGVGVAATIATFRLNPATGAPAFASELATSFTPMSFATSGPVK